MRGKLCGKEPRGKTVRGYILPIRNGTEKRSPPAGLRVNGVPEETTKAHHTKRQYLGLSLTKGIDSQVTLAPVN